MGWKKRDNRRLLIKNSKNGPCMDCGVQYPFYIMDFDHRPGEVKCFGLGDAESRSTAKILAEIDKCDLVCANCHRERTFNRGIVIQKELDKMQMQLFPVGAQ